MGLGKCSQYKNVVHQYAYKSMYATTSTYMKAMQAKASHIEPKMSVWQINDSLPFPQSEHDITLLNARIAIQNRRSNSTNSSSVMPLTNPPVFNVCKPGSGGYYEHAGGNGDVLLTLIVDSAETCCSTAGHTALGAAWQHVTVGETEKGGECTIFSKLYKGYSQQNATLGMVDTILDPTGFTDLDYVSALDGWTMGNIAVAPKDIVRFYQYVGTGKMLSPPSMKQVGRDERRFGNCYCPHG